MITEQDIKRRKDIIDFSRGNVRFEGVILSKEVEYINQQYINGEISNEEHSALGMAQVRKEFEMNMYNHNES